MTKKGIKISAGKLLLSEPFMADPHFRRAVVLMCEHNEEGSLGFILNKPIKMKIGQLIGDFPEFDAEAYYGGPVSTDTLHYLHNIGNLLEDSIEVSRGVYWGGDFEKLKFLIESKLVEPKNIRFYVGYSGWTPGQLQEELAFGSWVIGEMDANYVFKGGRKNIWKMAMENKGQNYRVIAQLPDSYNWN